MSVQRPPRRRVERVRVATLVDMLSVRGGAEHFAFLIATRLDPERFDSTLCVSRWPPSTKYPSPEADAEALARLDASPAHFVALERNRKVQFAPWVRLERYLRRERVHVLHTHKFGSNVWGTPIGRLARVPVVIAHEHTWSYEGQPMRRFLDRELVSRAADRFVSVSRADQRRMVEIEHIDPARTLFVPIGIVPPKPASGRDVRAELGIAPDAPVIGAVGLMRSQKALPVLLDATLELRRRWPDLVVLLVGDGPERAGLEASARELDLESTVRFLGMRGDVSDVLDAFDVAVCTSDFEGTPAAILEYMDAAVPVVSTDVGGIPDLIEDGVQGLLVSPRDPAAIAAATATLLEDPQRARQMGEAGRRRRRTEFDLDVMIGRFEALYCELLERRGWDVPSP